jgi:hypothetical protein
VAKALEGGGKLGGVNGTRAIGLTSASSPRFESRQGIKPRPRLR